MSAKKNRHAIAIAMLLACTVTTSAMSAQTTLSGEDGNSARQLSGRMDDAAAEQVARWARNSSESVLKLFVAGPGGDYEAARAAVAAIRNDARLRTVVVAQRLCADGCAAMWLAARNRSIHDGALLGFHGVACTDDCTEARRTRMVEIAAADPALEAVLAERGAFAAAPDHATYVRLTTSGWKVIE